MIDNTLKEKIIAILGKHYSNAIIAYLNEQEIFNADGTSFSSDSIRGFVNGNRENEIVEAAILDFISEKINFKSSLQKKRKNLLKK